MRVHGGCAFRQSRWGESRREASYGSALASLTLFQSGGLARDETCAGCVPWEVMDWPSLLPDTLLVTVHTGAEVSWGGLTPVTLHIDAG